jgi:hypothetical protein
MTLAGGHALRLQEHFGAILFRLTNTLADTSLHNICILFTEFSEAIMAVEVFKTTNLNEFHDGVQQGLEHEDWDYLIAHCTYNFAVIGMKNDISWIIKFFIYYISFKILYYLQLVQ